MNIKKYTDGIFYNQLLQLVQTAHIEYDRAVIELLNNADTADDKLKSLLTDRFNSTKEIYYNAYDTIAFYRIRRYICNSVWNDFFLQPILNLEKEGEIPECYSNIKQVIDMEKNKSVTEQKEIMENKE